jgi:uncharacterized protein YjiS (DUF1127 family)
MNASIAAGLARLRWSTRAAGSCIVRLAIAWAAQWRRHQVLRRRVAALRGLDLRTLRDIGIADHEITAIDAHMRATAEAIRERAQRGLFTPNW